MAHVLIPLPALDADPSEVALSWQVLRGRGHRVSFATPTGAPAQCDPIMLDGRGLDPWSRVPRLGRVRLLGLLLRADARARRAHAALLADPAFRAPHEWAAVRARDFDGLLLPGGHRARGMRDFLESTVLQALVAEFFAIDRPLAAICHGVLLVARSRAADGRSVLHGRRTTALTWRQERTASQLAHVGRWWDRDYYRTYTEQPGQPAGYMSVQAEVSRALASPAHFIDVPADDPHYRLKTLGLARDTPERTQPAWVVRDGRYVSARWPGDVHTFARVFAAVLEGLADGNVTDTAAAERP
jgi:putative intracellular protease/amidase